MRRMLDKIIRCYGAALTLTRGEEGWQLRGFLQPDGATGTQNYKAEYSPLGAVLPGQYTFIGPMEPEVQPGDTLTMDGTDYLLRRVEIVREGNEGLYQWGLCTKKGGADTWGDPL